MRMQIANKYTLEELQEIFNQIMIKIDKRQGPLQPGAAALFHYPEIFQMLRDEYIYSIIQKIVNEESVPGEDGEQPPELEMIDVYLGNIHVSPISRLWNTQQT